MLAKSKGLLVLLCVVCLSFSMAQAENLFVVKNGDTHVNDVVAIDGVNVYAVMEAGLFAGVSGAGETALAGKGLAFEGVGERMSGEYYLFQIERDAVNSLHPSVAVVYYDGKEAIATLQSDIDLGRNGNIKGLTRISFVPKPVVENKAGYQRGDILIDPEIQQIVDQVTEAQFTNWIQTMQDFVTRYSYSSSCRAAEQWAVNTFDSYGFDSELWAYTGEGGNTWYNAIGRKVGTVYPDSIYIIIGHLDAISEDPYNDAPGAEDNASGTAAVLEAARVMQGYDFDCTIEFICVTGEEQGLYGSEAYAQWCYNNNRNIGGVINFDMISYEGGYGWDTNIYADQYFSAEVALADLLGQLTDEYSDAYSIRVNTSGPQYGSDHYYFSYYGFPAPFSIDAQLWSAPDWYPWYHTTDDVITNCDLDFGTEVVKGAVACLATVANLSIPPVLEFSYPTGLPELVDPDGGTTFRVEVTAGTQTPQSGTGMLYYDTGNGYNSIAMQVVSPNVYDAVFPSIPCGSDVHFYVSAEATNGETVTDPRNAPDSYFSAFCADGIGVAYSDDFSSNQGWSGIGGSAEWTIGSAMGGSGNDNYGGPDPSQDHSPTSDNQVLGNDLNGGSGGDYNANIGSTYWVTSPTIDCTDYIGCELKFWRWLGVERSRYDHAYIQVHNGTSWVEIWENPDNTIDESAWQEITYDVSAYADGNASFQVRFGLGTTDGAWQYCGWNIDDLEVIGYSCGGTPEPDVAIEMVPNNPPVTVPRGGYFTYTGILQNNTQQHQMTDVWVMLGLPGGAQYGPVQQFNNVWLNPGQNITVNNVRQDVPSFAPLGTYDYISYCGDYPSTKLDSSSFEFTVTSGVAGEVDGWNLYGWFDDKANTPARTGLNGNYPNPFNANTTINYSLASDADVILEVYNLMGQRVAVLVDGMVQAGEHSVNWDATRHSSGIYFYKLSVGNETFTKRMTLLK